MIWRKKRKLTDKYVKELDIETGSEIEKIQTKTR